MPDHILIPYGRQCIDADDIEAVVDVLRSDWLTQGPAIERFEQEVARYCGAAHAIAVSNGTAALHLACLALKVGPGDTVWTTPNTFVASANCALYCGANVDFVDIDPRTFNMSPELLAAKLEKAETQGRLPKVIVAVDFGGQPCELKQIALLAKRYGFHVLEDASHALGAEYCGSKVGSNAYSDITVFSFHPVKIMTTGEGGMALTNDPELARRFRLLRTHGITRDPSAMSGAIEGGWYYEQLELGFNYRMTDIQAALGSSQLRKVDQFIARRSQLARQYDQALRELPLRPAEQLEGSCSAYHLYVICLEQERGSRARRDVFSGLRQAGIGVNVHYIPVHTQPYYRRFGFKPEDFPNALRYYQGAISLPLYYGLTDEQQQYIIEKLKEQLSA
ncbi:MAG TPA: UDP-4-amino-4,6-dideoxy-N-acetyl-beta-L-altrosamine transaminase [Terracidiphilus sp.]|jgi:UDP-4-amino-4,6-dideoxy-N-acetyl-beta-L-altrosamine transaminase